MAFHLLNVLRGCFACQAGFVVRTTETSDRSYKSVEIRFTSFEEDLEKYVDFEEIGEVVRTLVIEDNTMLCVTLDPNLLQYLDLNKMQYTIYGEKPLPRAHQEDDLASLYAFLAVTITTMLNIRADQDVGIIRADSIEFTDSEGLRIPFSAKGRNANSQDANFSNTGWAIIIPGPSSNNIDATSRKRENLAENFFFQLCSPAYTAFHAKGLLEMKPARVPINLKFRAEMKPIQSQKYTYPLIKDWIADFRDRMTLPSKAAVLAASNLPDMFSFLGSPFDNSNLSWEDYHSLAQKAVNVEVSQEARIRHGVDWAARLMKKILDHSLSAVVPQAPKSIQEVEAAKRANAKSLNKLASIITKEFKSSSVTSSTSAAILDKVRFNVSDLGIVLHNKVHKIEEEARGKEPGSDEYNELVSLSREIKSHVTDLGHMMSKFGSVTPTIADVCNEMQNAVDKVRDRIKTADLQDEERMIRAMSEAPSFFTVWSLAARLKGSLYEKCFAATYDLNYTREEFKPSISDIVRLKFPSKYLDFLDGISKQPHLANLKPDFIMFPASQNDPVYDFGQEIVDPEIESVATDTIVEQSASGGELARSLKSSQAKSHNSQQLALAMFRSEHDSSMAHLQKKDLMTAPTCNRHEMSTCLIDGDLTILEVGCTTLQEEKVESDHTKWRTVLVVLRKKCGLKVNYLGFNDSAAAPSTNWRLSTPLADIFNGHIKVSFDRLKLISPPESADKMIRQIMTSTHSSRKTARCLLTPNISDLEHKITVAAKLLKMIDRPLGEGLMTEDIASMYFSMARQLRLKPSSCQSMQGCLTSMMGYLERVQKSKPDRRVCQTDGTTCWKFLLSWITKDNKGKYCDICLPDLFKQDASSLSRDSLRTLLRSVASTVKSLPTCRCSSEKLAHKPHIRSRVAHILKSIKDLPRSNTVDLEGSILSDSEILDEDDEPQDRTDDDQSEDPTGKEPSILDKIVAMTVPGKTPLERRSRSKKNALVILLCRHSKLNCIKIRGSKIIFIGQQNTKTQFSTETDLLVRKADQLANADEQSQTEVQKIKELAQSLVNQDGFLTSSQKKVFEELASMTEEEMVANTNRSLCQLDQEKMIAIINHLGLTKSERGQLETYLFPNTDKEVLAGKDDRYLDLSESQLKEALQAILTDSKENFEGLNISSDCFIPKAIVDHFKKMQKDTVYEGAEERIGKLFAVLASQNSFKGLLLYSLMCSTYLKSLSDGCGAGLKVYKIPHTQYNLVSKVPRSASTNCMSVVTNSDFTKATRHFFLDRRSAVLGQAYPFVVILLALQQLQNFHCLTQIDLMSTEDIALMVRAETAEKLESFCDSLPHMFDGKPEQFWNGVRLMPNSRFKAAKVDRKPAYKLSLVLSSLITNFCHVLGPELLRNSRVFNKQIQTIRYPYMLAFSELGFCDVLGEKMSSPCRKIETKIAQLYLQALCYKALEEPARNIKFWKEEVNFPDVNVPSVSCLGLCIPNARCFSTDIYLVHIYNKEIDDFGQGSIDVLQEFAEKHFEWEERLIKNKKCYLRALEEVKQGVTGAKARLKSEWVERCQLIGIPEISKIKDARAYVERDFQTIVSTFGEGSQEAQVMRRLHQFVAGKEEGTSSSNPEESSAVESSTSRGVLSNSDHPTAFKGRRKVMFDSLTEPDSDPSRRSGQSTTFATKLDLGGNEYIPSLPRFRSCVEKAAKDCPDVSKGSATVIQLAAEVMRIKAINKPGVSLRDPKSNVKTITDIMETTSIISSPRFTINLQSVIRSIIEQEALKISKEFTKYNKGPSSTAVPLDIAKLAEESASQCLDLSPGLELIKESALRKIKRMTAVNRAYWRDNAVGGREMWVEQNSDELFMTIKSLQKDISEHHKENGLFKKTFNANFFQTKMAESSFREEVDFKKGHISDRFMEALMEEAVKSSEGEFIEVWAENTYEFIMNKNRNLHFTEDNFYVLDKIDELLKEQARICRQRLENPDVGLTAEQRVLIKDEQQVCAKGASTIDKVILITTIACLSHPVLLYGAEKHTVAVLGLAKASALSEDGDNSPYTMNLLKVVMKIILKMASPTTAGRFCWVEETHRYASPGGQSPWSEIEFLTLIQSNFGDLSQSLAYCLLCRYSSSNPLQNFYSALYSKLSVSTKELLEALQSAVSYHFFGWNILLELDVMCTVQTARCGDTQKTRELFNNSGRSPVPKSTRSKVIFEMLKLSYVTDTAVIQTLAYDICKDLSHTNFAGLAPKAQFGGNRDLLVQEKMTKVLNSSCEAFAEGVLGHTQRDAMTNHSLADSFLDDCHKLAQESYRNHGKLAVDQNKSGTIFHKVVMISGDHKKWGPKHSCMHFNSMYAQLLINHPDIYRFTSCVMVKSLEKRIEIPSASTEKILRSFVKSRFFRPEFLNKSSESSLVAALREFSKEWDWSPVAGNLLRSYLMKSQMCMNSYSHMGQGIHHKTSSVLTAAVSYLVEDIILEFSNQHFPGVSVNIIHAGSSDDFAKILDFQGVLGKEDFDVYSTNFWTKICSLMNIIFCIHGICQCKVSEKTVVSSIFGEFYSTFSLFHSVSPSQIKFTSSQVINFSITSISDIVTSTFASCQQSSMYSVPYATNSALALFRQSLVYNSVSNLMVEIGPIVTGLVTAFGGCFVPLFSNLYSSGILSQDLRTLQQSCENLLMILELQLNLPTAAHGEEGSQSGGVSSAGSIAGHSGREGYDTDAESRACCHSEASRHLPFEKEVGNRKVQVSSIINMLAVSYYFKKTVSDVRKKFKSDAMSKHESLFNDPFIQTLPDSVRRYQSEARDVKSEHSLRFSNLKARASLAKDILLANCSTEDIVFENNTIQMALSGSKIALGLSGAAKEISLPMLRKFLLSYCFHDASGCVASDEWKGTQTSRKESVKKVRYLEFIKMVAHAEVALCEAEGCGLCNSLCVTDVSAISTISRLKPATVLRPGSATKKGKICVHLRQCELLRELSIKLKNLIEPEYIDSLKHLEGHSSSPTEIADETTVYKTKIYMKTKKAPYVNSLAILACYRLHPETILETSVRGVDYSLLAAEEKRMETEFPDLVSLLDSVQDDQTLNPDVSSLACSLIRELGSGTRGATKLHIISSIHHQAVEETLNPLVMYNVVEGLKIDISSTSAVARVPTMKLYTVMRVLSGLLNSLRPKGNDMINFLKLFLNWRPYSGHEAYCKDFDSVRAKLTDKATATMKSIILSEVMTGVRDYVKRTLYDMISVVEGTMYLSEARVSDFKSNTQKIGDLKDRGLLVYGDKENCFVLTCCSGTLYATSNTTNKVFISKAIHLSYSESISEQNPASIESLDEFLGRFLSTDQRKFRRDQTVAQITRSNIPNDESFKVEMYNRSLDPRPSLLIEKNIKSPITHSSTTSEKSVGRIRWTGQQLQLYDEVKWSRLGEATDFDRTVEFLTELLKHSKDSNQKIDSSIKRRESKVFIRGSLKLPVDLDQDSLACIHVFYAHSGINLSIPTRTAGLTDEEVEEIIQENLLSDYLNIPDGNATPAGEYVTIRTDLTHTGEDEISVPYGIFLTKLGEFYGTSADLTLVPRLLKRVSVEGATFFPSITPDNLVTWEVEWDPMNNSYRRNEGLVSSLARFADTRCLPTSLATLSTFGVNELTPIAMSILEISRKINHNTAAADQLICLIQSLTIFQSRPLTTIKKLDLIDSCKVAKGFDILIQRNKVYPPNAVCIGGLQSGFLRASVDIISSRPVLIVEMAPRLTVDQFSSVFEYWKDLNLSAEYIRKGCDYVASTHVLDSKSLDYSRRFEAAWGKSGIIVSELIKKYCKPVYTYSPLHVFVSKHSKPDGPLFTSGRMTGNDVFLTICKMMTGGLEVTPRTVQGLTLFRKLYYLDEAFKTTEIVDEFLVSILHGRDFEDIKALVYTGLYLSLPWLADQWEGLERKVHPAVQLKASPEKSSRPENLPELDLEIPLAGVGEDDDEGPIEVPAHFGFATGAVKKRLF